jgi:hypothetical protein
MAFAGWTRLSPGEKKHKINIRQSSLSAANTDKRKECGIWNRTCVQTPLNTV